MTFKYKGKVFKLVKLQTGDPFDSRYYDLGSGANSVEAIMRTVRYRIEHDSFEASRMLGDNHKLGGWDQGYWFAIEVPENEFGPVSP